MNEVKPDAPKPEAPKPETPKLEKPEPVPILDADKPLDVDAPEPKTPQPKTSPPPEKPKPDKAAKAAKTAKPAKPPKKKPSFLVVALRWLLLILVLFGMGALLIIFALYVPARSELSQANEQLQDASSQYKAELQQANQEIERLSTFEDQNMALQEELKQANLYIVLLQIRTDVLSAQLALSEDDYATAGLALSKTPDRLDQLASLLPQEYGEIIATLKMRLELAISGIKSGDTAAVSDLGVLSTKLLELEDALIR